MKLYDIDERNPSQSGILHGECKGICWMNSNQRLAITYSYCVGGCGIFGEITDRNQDIDFFKEVFCQLKKAGMDEFEFSAEDDQLREDVLALFTGENIQSEMELSYRIPDYNIISDVQVTGYDIVKVDREFLNRIEEKCYHNYESIVERIRESWQGNEDFLLKSSAFVAIKENEIVGVIFGSGRINDILAIDIEVEKEHRKKGLAKKLSYELIKDCAKNEIRLQWDCIESNKASIATAKSLGFQLFKKRPYYWFSI